MDLHVQLKVCEGCGCLWYRPQSHRGVYCLGCDVRLKQFPPPRGKRRPGQKDGATLLQVWAVDHRENCHLFLPVEAAGGAE